MKRTSLYKIILLLAVFALLSSCVDQFNPSPSQELNKDALYNKSWYNSNGAQHYFRSDGVYNTSGSWRWINNSDSMMITSGVKGGSSEVWYFQWASSMEMTCRQGADGTWMLYRAQEW